MHDAADPEAEIIFGSLIDEALQDEVKITLIATGFQHREGKQQRPTAVQVPLIARTSPVTSSPLREEVLAAAASAKAVSRPPMAVGEYKAPVLPRAINPKDGSLPVDDDQFDIPTFLRRHHP